MTATAVTGALTHRLTPISSHRTAARPGSFLLVFAVDASNVRIRVSRTLLTVCLHSRDPTQM